MPHSSATAAQRLVVTNSLPSVHPFRGKSCVLLTLMSTCRLLQSLISLSDTLLLILEMYQPKSPEAGTSFVMAPLYYSVRGPFGKESNQLCYAGR